MVVISLFQVKNGLTRSLLVCFCFVFLFVFFSENAKNLGRSDDAKRRKNGEGLIRWPNNKLE